MAYVTEYEIVDILILWTALIALAYFYMTRKFNYWTDREVTQKQPTPFVGNFSDPLFGRCSVGQWLCELYEYGAGSPYVGFHIFDQPALLVRDVELVKNILVRDFDSFHNRFSTVSSADTLGQKNMFFLKNPAWKLLRTKIAPIYTTGKLKKLFELMVEVGEDLNKYMDSLNFGENGEDLEVREIFAKFTTDMIGTTAFGIKVNSLNNPDAEFRKCGKTIFAPTFYRSVEFISIYFYPSISQLLRFKFFPSESSRFLRKVMWEVIADRELSGTKRHDLIDILVELKNTHQETTEKEIFEFDGDNLVAQTATFFIGGFETASTALSFTLYELALNHDIQSKLREEIVAALYQTNGKITYDMINSLPYLSMVTAETLRKYPVLPFLDRISNKHYQVPNSNFIIEKDTPIFISVMGLHHDPEYFPDPDKFDPERFSEENKRSGMSCTYIPFGDGPHICIAMRLGLLQMMLGLVKLLPKYEFSVCKTTSIPLRMSTKSFLLSAEGGVILNVKKITSL